MTRVSVFRVLFVAFSFLFDFFIVGGPFLALRALV